MTTAMDRVNGTRDDIDLEAAARAEAIRREAESKAEAERIRAQAEAEAKRIKAAEEAEALRLRNARNRRRDEREEADHAAKIAEAHRKREEAERATAKARAEDQAAEQAKKETAQRQAKAAKSWRKAALGFAIVCGIVALPVQMSAFWSPSAPWLLAAPVFLEGGAWVILRGAAAAVEDHRPHWHYRLIAWVLAAVAACVNFAHGMHAFDAATAAATAFASLAGPGVWDLHEHGRIRTRDGKLTRRERREQRAQEKKEAAREKARAEAAKKIAERLAELRAKEYAEEWAYALRLAAALGETTVTDAVWEQTWDDLHALKPGQTVDAIRTRNNAARRVAGARSEAPGEKPVKVTNTQRASQVPTGPKKRTYKAPTVRGVRRKGDTKYSAGARRAMSETAKQAAAEKQGVEQ
jgi:hypothetical protein